MSTVSTNPPASTPSPDWTELPEDIGIKILQHLDSCEAYGSLAKTCRSWRQATQALAALEPYKIHLKDHVQRCSSHPIPESPTLSELYPDYCRYKTAEQQFWTSTFTKTMIDVDQKFGYIRYADLSPCGQLLAVACSKALVVYLVSNAQIQLIPLHVDLVLFSHSGCQHVTFSPKSTHLASSAGLDTIQLWEIKWQDKKPYFELLSEHESELGIPKIKFSPDGNMIAIYNDGLFIRGGCYINKQWQDPENAKPIWTITPAQYKEKNFKVTGVEFSKDSQTAFIYVEDKLDHAWQVDGSKPLPKASSLTKREAALDIQAQIIQTDEEIKIVYLKNNTNNYPQEMKLLDNDKNNSIEMSFFSLCRKKVIIVLEKNNIYIFNSDTSDIFTTP